MPGCLGLDALWQLTGFFLGWLGLPGRGRALGVGEVKFADQVLPTVKKVIYGVDMKRVFKGKLDPRHRRRLAGGRRQADLRGQGHARRPVQPVDAEPGLATRDARTRWRRRMRRVVVTGMGIVSSIGTTPRKSPPACTRQVRRHARRPNLPNWASAPRSRARRRSVPRRSSTAARCASTAAAPPGTMSRWIRRSSTAGSSPTRSPTSAPASSWARAAPRPGRSSRPPTSPAPRARSGSARSRCRSRCPRPRRRRSRPGSRSRASSYSISSACATSNHCIGAAYEHILIGKQDVMFAGGCEELDWTLSVLFDAMGAMSSAYNETPARASRAYDKNRDGFVISAGAGVLVLEDLRAGQGARRAGSTARSPATARPPTATTWSRPPAKARRAACARRWRP